LCCARGVEKILCGKDRCICGPQFVGGFTLLRGDRIARSRMGFFLGLQIGFGRGLARLCKLYPSPGRKEQHGQNDDETGQEGHRA